MTKKWLLGCVNSHPLPECIITQPRAHLFDQPCNMLQQVLGTRDLVSLGVGSCVGTGMYLVSGMVAKKMAGPAVVLSYAIAGFAALLSGK